ncbi:GNAT family N-acetyltransferase [Priestia endophytica]|uniref:GNAT family N-acetyltransferase n=1 Tax=Priestia endophytica TaxID=135735 RepID=UPI00124BE59D|nr:GNAT family N-acetyltransferase [Priestia endophytica]KAB2488218.1 GNAT family N-acetyltransferase [Priestia endophytica]
MTLSIRRMKDEDISQVQHVAKTGWHDTYKEIIPLNIQEVFLNFAYSHKMLQERIRQSVMLVAEYNGEIVGFANYSPIKKENQSELSAIYIQPEFQRRGIGTALLTEGIKTLRGIREIFVNVEKENKVGTSFYKRKGFKIISEFDDNFDGHILKTVRMFLAIN